MIKIKEPDKKKIESKYLKALSPVKELHLYCK